MIRPGWTGTLARKAVNYFAPRCADASSKIGGTAIAWIYDQAAAIAWISGVVNL